MSRKESNWLLGELPALVTEGVLDAAAAERLRARYAGAGRGGRSWAVMALSLLGALLIGLGLIMILAHNWGQLTRTHRAILSFLPLLAAQALGGWVLARRPDRGATREGAAIFWTLAIGACISLISQTYHLGGTWDAFTLVWMLLTLPVIYLLRAVLPAVLYLAGLVAWASIRQWGDDSALWYWPLAALVLPAILAETRPDPYRLRPVALLWAFSLAGTAAVGVTLEKVMPGLWIVIYAGLFGVLYLAGGFWGAEAPAAWQRPLHTLGSLGTVVLALMLTYEWPWEQIGWHHLRHDPAYHPLRAGFDYALAFALPVAAVALGVTSLRRGQARRIPFGLFPVCAIAGYGLTAGGSGPGLPLLLFNGYVLALGLATLVQGVRDRRLGTVNGGMLTLMALILLRFFDSDLPFLGKGVTFMALGAVFLIVNLRLARRAGGAA